MQWVEEIGVLLEDEGVFICIYFIEMYQCIVQQIVQWMCEVGMYVYIDVVGNVVGCYFFIDLQVKILLIGLYYDMVCNGGKYDGCEGILLFIVVVKYLYECGEILFFYFEVIGFLEEEGVCFKSIFLGSNVVIGYFDMKLLDLQDKDGISMCEVIIQVGYDVVVILQIVCDLVDILGYVEVYIEQGLVLFNCDLLVGIVILIVGSLCYLVELKGVVSYVGIMLMDMCKDVVVVVVEIIFYVEQCCLQDQYVVLVGMVGQLQVLCGLMNVILGVCQLLLDICVVVDEVCMVVVKDILGKIEEICGCCSIDFKLEEILSVVVVLCVLWLMDQLCVVMECVGVMLFELVFGVGYDVMVIVKLMDVCMLFM